MNAWRCFGYVCRLCPLHERKLEAAATSCVYLDRITQHAATLIEFRNAARKLEITLKRKLRSAGARVQDIDSAGANQKCVEPCRAWVCARLNQDVVAEQDASSGRVRNLIGRRTRLLMGDLAVFRVCYERTVNSCRKFGFRKVGAVASMR